MSEHEGRALGEMANRLRGTAARRWAALGLLCCAFFIDVMGSTSGYPASPSIVRALSLTPAELQWSFIAVTLPAGALLLAGGRLADLFGRRRMFMLGVALQVLSSLACGTAPARARRPWSRRRVAESAGRCHAGS